MESLLRPSLTLPSENLISSSRKLLLTKSEMYDTLLTLTLPEIGVEFDDKKKHKKKTRNKNKWRQATAMIRKGKWHTEEEEEIGIPPPPPPPSSLS